MTTRPPIITCILTSHVTEQSVSNGTWLIVMEHEALDIIGQRWRLVESVTDGAKTLHSWAYQGRERDNVLTTRE